MSSFSLKNCRATEKENPAEELAESLKKLVLNSSAVQARLGPEGVVSGASLEYSELSAAALHHLCAIDRKEKQEDTLSF